MKTNHYFVLILDIVESSKLRDRGKLTEMLNAAIVEANKKYSKELWAPFEITKGDEVAAVLLSINQLFDMITLFSDAIYPIEFRSALVYGKLSAGLETKRSTIIDGPAFYLVNEKMIQLKKTQKTFSFNSGLNDLDEATEALMNLILWRWKSFSSLQRDIIRNYQQEKNQVKVATLLRKKQQQIQQTLKSCKWEILDNAEKAVKHLFQIIENRILVEGD